MNASSTLTSINDVRAFIDEYFKAWQGTDEDRIVSYYAETVYLEIPGMVINGKAALRDQFVRPFIAVVRGILPAFDIAQVEYTWISSSA